MILELENLHKWFGDHHVLRGISLKACSGSAFGLLGRNGAGKTTTIRLLMDVFKPDQGRILLDGEPLATAQRKMGYLPEEKGLYPKQAVLRQMVYIGELRGLSREAARRSAEQKLERLGMARCANQKLETLSKGNQQKIQLAVALIHDPEIVILDEPFSGLDPVNAQLLKDVVREQVEAGRLVFFSSHQMSYIESFCDQIALLNQGEIVLSGSIKELKRAWKRNRFELRLREGDLFPEPEAMAARLRGLADSGRIRCEIKEISALEEGVCVTLGEAGDRDTLLFDLVTAGLSLDHFAVLEPGLEEIFVHYSGQERRPEHE